MHWQAPGGGDGATGDADSDKCLPVKPGGSARRARAVVKPAAESKSPTRSLWNWPGRAPTGTSTGKLQADSDSGLRDRDSERPQSDRTGRLASDSDRHGPLALHRHLNLRVNLTTDNLNLATGNLNLITDSEGTADWTQAQENLQAGSGSGRRPQARAAAATASGPLP